MNITPFSIWNFARHDMSTCSRVDSVCVWCSDTHRDGNEPNRTKKKKKESAFLHLIRLESINGEVFSKDWCALITTFAFAMLYYYNSKYYIVLNEHQQLLRSVIILCVSSVWESVYSVFVHGMLVALMKTIHVCVCVCAYVDSACT